jgi:hypothetical protein
MVKLTPEEIAWVKGLYANTKELGITALVPVLRTEKQQLTPLRYMPDSHALMLCYDYENMPFHSTKLTEWHIEREWDKCIIKVRHPASQYSYHINTDSGNVTLFNQRKPSTLGAQVYVMQYYMKNHFAFPLFF